jgi:hypothetical protein
LRSNAVTTFIGAEANSPLPNKALQLTRRRPGACEVRGPAGGRLSGGSGGRPPEYHGATRAARS